MAPFLGAEGPLVTGRQNFSGAGAAWNISILAAGPVGMALALIGNATLRLDGSVSAANAAWPGGQAPQE